MKKILLTSRSLENFNETYSSFDMNWFSYLKNTKVTLVPNIPSRLNDYLDTSQFSGVILTGGGDIKENKLSNNNHDVYREQVEEQLIKYSIQNNIPLICVCRGMQKAMTFLETNVKFVHNPINPEYTHKQVKYTVKTFSAMFNKGTYVVLVHKHALTIKDGIVVDNPNNRFDGYRRVVMGYIKVK